MSQTLNKRLEIEADMATVNVGAMVIDGLLVDLSDHMLDHGMTWPFYAVKASVTRVQEVHRALGMPNEYDIKALKTLALLNMSELADEPGKIRRDTYFQRVGGAPFGQEWQAIVIVEDEQEEMTAAVWGFVGDLKKIGLIGTDRQPS